MHIIYASPFGAPWHAWCVTGKIAPPKDLDCNVSIWIVPGTIPD